jgi:flagellar motor switch protein FliG
MENKRRAADAYRKTQGLIKATEDNTAQPAEKSPPASARSGANKSDVSLRGKQPASALESRSTFELPLAGTRDTLTQIARFLTLIGRAEASAVLRRMSRQDADRILDAMAHLGPISAEEARRVLVRFGSEVREPLHATAAGPETAREILVRAFGAGEGDRRFYAILPEARPRRFAFLENADGRQLGAVLRNESPATLAILCANMPGAAAARLLEAISVPERPEIVRRMATMKTVAPEVLQAIETTLRNKLEAIERPDADEIDGESRLAEILRFMDLSSSERILHEIESHRAEVAEHVRQQLTSPDDILYLSDRDVQRLLQRIDDIDLAVFLKGKRDELQAQIMRNMTERRRDMVAMHRETLGPMRRADVDRITREIIDMIQQMARDGEIVVHLPGEEYV